MSLPAAETSRAHALDRRGQPRTRPSHRRAVRILDLDPVPRCGRPIPSDVLRLNLFRRYAKQPAGTAVFEHPERAVRPDLYVTNAMADVPAFRPPWRSRR